MTYISFFYCFLGNKEPCAWPLVDILMAKDDNPIAEHQAAGAEFANDEQDPIRPVSLFIKVLIIINFITEYRSADS